ncbi:YbfB/YjiJ family MFS transporter [Bradyrhizobium sp. LHD-71]|uniref:YbfB/YjiJ family MFS transporter n=1 Tax=Bradyrhizobium sp. LHD-71 TaxID=3072141 RepID=UPI00280FFE89|nr:YbfB/YjiJ family MFS transporter [Bradyrhizobium sp. LHD-71]MDQ8728525.1 YbfB/YjiJ family MFS transporter [Bradyrhizobium sp. LHD-71]
MDTRTGAGSLLAQPPVPALPIALIVWAALGIALNIGAARFAYGVMLPSLRRDLSLDYFTAGALNAVHLLGYLIGTLVAPSLARRTTMARFSMLSYAVVAAGALLCAIAPQEPLVGALVFGLGRLTTGLGAGGGIMAVMVIAFAAVAAERRALVSAMVWSGMGIATILSGAAAPLLLADGWGWRIAFAATVVLALSIAIFFPPRGTPGDAAQPEGAAHSTFNVRQLLAAKWLFLLAAYFMFAFGYIAWSTFAGARLAAASAPMIVIQMTWIVFGAATMMGAALTVPLSRSAALRHHALSVSFILAAAGALVTALDAGAAALIGALLVGLGAGATPTIVSAHARDRCRAEDYARAFSYAAAALGVGQLLGPLVAGRFADLFGTVAVPLLAAGVYSVGAVLAICDGRQAGRAAT